MSNRGGGRSGGQRRGGGGGARNPNRSQRDPNSPAQQPKPTTEQESLEPQQPAPSPKLSPQSADSPKVSSQPESKPAQTGGKNPPQKKGPPPNTKPPAKASTPVQPKSPASQPEEQSTTAEPVESPKSAQPAKKPAQQNPKTQTNAKPAPQNQPKKENQAKPAQAKPAQQTQAKPAQQTQQKKPAGQPAAAGKNQPPKKDAGKPASKPTKAVVVEDEDSDDQDPTISAATGGIFQFGQPVHGFTPMSFNFSLPAGNEAAPVEPELPSHSGPCVVTTGGVTYELNQKPTVTLEEDEDVVFANYAKLYRYDGESSEWKERGVGDFKILKHKNTQKYRILMRRDKILKICANHSVPAVELKTHPTYPETAWVYQTDADYSDEVAKKTTFAVRFKTAEVAKQFQTVYDQARSTLPIDIKKPSASKSPSPKASSPTTENVHKAVIEIKSDLGLESRPPAELTLDFLYKEIMEIKSTLQTMQQDIQQLKKSSHRK